MHPWAELDELDDEELDDDALELEEPLDEASEELPLEEVESLLDELSELEVELPEVEVLELEGGSGLSPQPQQFDPRSCTSPQLHPPIVVAWSQSGIGRMRDTVGEVGSKEMKSVQRAIVSADSLEYAERCSSDPARFTQRSCIIDLKS